MLLDLHIHSKFSPDGRTTVRSIVRTAKMVGLGGIAVTDHNSVRSHRFLKKYATIGLILVPGIEVSSQEGHILAYGVDTEIKRGLSAKETVEFIEDAGGLAVAAHPYRRVTGLGENVVIETGFDVLETFNSRTMRNGNMKAKILANRLNASVTGGSDAHTLGEIGRAHTEVPDDVGTPEDLIEAIRNRRSSSAGIPPHMGKFVRDRTGNVVGWVRRGLRKM